MLLISWNLSVMWHILQQNVNIRTQNRAWLIFMQNVLYGSAWRGEVNERCVRPEDLTKRILPLPLVRIIPSADLLEIAGASINSAKNGLLRAPSRLIQSAP
jgi:hypothetical protein